MAVAFECDHFHGKILHCSNISLAKRRVVWSGQPLFKLISAVGLVAIQQFSFAFDESSTTSTIASSSESADEASFTDPPEPGNSSFPRKRRHQTLYDVVANRSRHDRFVNPNQYSKKTGKHNKTRPVPPESVLVNRWRQQLKYKNVSKGFDEEDEQVELSQAGLIIPATPNNALPDSVLSPRLLSDPRIYSQRFINTQQTSIVFRGWKRSALANSMRLPC